MSPNTLLASAQLGYHVLYLRPNWRDVMSVDNPPAVSAVYVLLPVVAWLVKDCDSVLAVTPEGVAKSTYLAVLMPDGRVVANSGRVYLSDELWIGDLLGRGV